MPLSTAAKQLVSRAQYLLKRDAFDINQLTGLALTAISDDQLNDEDWQVLLMVIEVFQLAIQQSDGY